MKNWFSYETFDLFLSVNFQTRRLTSSIAAASGTGNVRRFGQRDQIRAVASDEFSAATCTNPTTDGWLGSPFVRATSSDAAWSFALKIGVFDVG